MCIFFTEIQRNHETHKGSRQYYVRLEGGAVMAYYVLPYIGPPKWNSSLTLMIIPKVIRIDLAHIFDFFHYGGTIVLLSLTGGGHFVLRNTVCSPNELSQSTNKVRLLYLPSSPLSNVYGHNLGNLITYF